MHTLRWFAMTLFDISVRFHASRTLSGSLSFFLRARPTFVFIDERRAFSSHVMVHLLADKRQHMLDHYLPRSGAIILHRHFLFPINFSSHWFFAVVTLASRQVVNGFLVSTFGCALTTRFHFGIGSSTRLFPLALLGIDVVPNLYAGSFKVCWTRNCEPSAEPKKWTFLVDRRWPQQVELHFTANFHR